MEDTEMTTGTPVQADTGSGTAEGKSKGKFWTFIDDIAADKVVSIVVLMLAMFSILAIFSSTPLLDDGGKDRLDIMKEQFFTVALGLVTLFCIYKIDKVVHNPIKFFMFFSRLGFAISLIMLVILDLHLNLGIIKAVHLNNAYRILKVGGLQIHVFEVVKVAMVMYISWACHNYRKDQQQIAESGKSDCLKLANHLSKYPHLSFLAKPFWKRALYMYLPVVTTFVLVLVGSGSSAIFITVILLAILMIGGIPFRDVIIGGILGIGMLAAGFSLYKISEGKMLSMFERFDTMEGRVQSKYDVHELSKMTPGTVEFYRERDRILQPYGAKVAIHEGGLTGKGIGNSTQRYIVTNIYGDYMFSFVIEEYGLLGAIVLIILYVSLLARGAQISRLCTKDFTKLAVGGLTLLITGQAFMHMLVNVDIGPMTGQTLPLVSHGAFSFLMFSIAFGIILNISKLTKTKMAYEEETAAPIYEREKDDIQASMDILDKLDSGEFDNLTEEDLID